MASELPVTRRTFLKVVGGSVATVTVSAISSVLSGCATNTLKSEPSAKFAGGDDREPNQQNETLDWAPEPGKARWRIEGVRKVTGAKIYARDFKAADFDGWPKQEYWLYALRCDRVNQIVVNFDLRVLPNRYQPLVVITSETLEQNGIPMSLDSNPDNRLSVELLARRGKPAGCYGQPIALLIFENFDVYRCARKILDFNPGAIQYGAPASAPTDPPGTFNDNAAPFSDAKIYVRNDARQFWNTNMVPDADGNPSAAFLKQCHCEREIIRRLAESNAEKGDWLKFGTGDGIPFHTPAMDPMFMEPESGLAWYDPESNAMQLVLGTQSPRDDGYAAINLFKASSLKLSGAHVVACYSGGAFGGRDKSPFPAYLALAARFAKRPLRWQLSRYEQFQVGLKRAETRFEESIWLDKLGRIQALDSQFLLNSGGRMNLTRSVADLAALSAMSCYDIPYACAEGTTVYSPEVYGGSQRGFGGPQAFMAIETLLDEAAQALGKSPFEIRRINLLGAPGSRTITGGKILFDLQLKQHLNLLEAHPVWTGRETKRAERAKLKLRYGVGLAMSNHAYGTGVNGMFAMVEIQQNARLRVLTTHADMGNGAATTLALAPAEQLGQNAQRIELGEVDAFVIKDFDSRQTGKWSKFPGTKGLATPYGSASACLGAFQQYQAVDRAAMTLMLHSVLPAARLLWRDQRIRHDEVKWVGGKLTTTSHSALSWPMLLDEINRMQWDTVAAVHLTYGGDFWKGRYPLRSGNYVMDCDFIAVGSNVHDLKTITHENLTQPKEITVGYGRTNYAPAAALVAVSVAPHTGRVKVERVVTTLSAGRLICPEIVEGQSQGGVAMAIGNILSESCDLGPTGPGNGRWNLDRYQITRMSDIPIQQLICLPPPDGSHRHEARGIGEAVMCPIGPALLNALAMATGHRFRKTPVTPDVIVEALK